MPYYAKLTFNNVLLSPACQGIPQKWKKSIRYLFCLLRYIEIGPLCYQKGHWYLTTPQRRVHFPPLRPSCDSLVGASIGPSVQPRVNKNRKISSLIECMYVVICKYVFMTGDFKISKSILPKIPWLQSGKLEIRINLTDVCIAALLQEQNTHPS